VLADGGQTPVWNETASFTLNDEPEVTITVSVSHHHLQQQQRLTEQWVQQQLSSQHQKPGM
jgi:hypothetical protein